jgi:CRISPR type III-associated protein (TIGR04423 family)
MELKDIPNYAYEGYIWFSDQPKPKVLRNDRFEFENIGQNPFIIEALLWAEKEKVAVHISHTHRYLIHIYDLKTLENIDNKEISYLAHKIDGVKKLKFRQIWQSEEDSLCEGMDVLEMKAQVFIGFENN